LVIVIGQEKEKKEDYKYQSVERKV